MKHNFCSCGWTIFFFSVSLFFNSEYHLPSLSLLEMIVSFFSFGFNSQRNNFTSIDFDNGNSIRITCQNIWELSVLLQKYSENPARPTDPRSFLIYEMLWIQIYFLFLFHVIFFHLSWNGSCKSFHKWLENIPCFTAKPVYLCTSFWNAIC